MILKTKTKFSLFLTNNSFFRHFSTQQKLYNEKEVRALTILDSILIDLLHAIAPFAIYPFYVAYKKVDDERENELAIIITIFSSLYLCLKYNIRIIDSLPLITINIPLIISYYKKNNIAIVMASVVVLAYSYKFYNSFLLLLIIEYLLYGIIYKLLNNKKTKFNTFVILFASIKTLFMFVILSLNHANLNMYLEALSLGIIFLLSTLLTIFLLKKGKDILRIHRIAKDIEHDKQIRTSLFQITHEIKNPIAVCKGYLDMFDVNNKNHAKKYIPIMKEEIDKTLVLLEDFLSMNKIKLNKDILDINLLLEEVVESFKLFWQEHKIKSEINIPEDEIYINGDYNRLRQVFLNIIKNSMEALNDNPTITISTELKKNKIYIYFKDNGSGIPKDILEKIKEPFFTTKQKGTGLGVPLSNEIIEAHGGKLIYDSKEGEYTVVTIVLNVIEI